MFYEVDQVFGIGQEPHHPHFKDASDACFLCPGDHLGDRGQRRGKCPTSLNPRATSGPRIHQERKRCSQEIGAAFGIAGKRNMDTLRNKTALVTGASRGIGRATASALAAFARRTEAGPRFGALCRSRVSEQTFSPRSLFHFTKIPQVTMNLPFIASSSKDGWFLNW